MPIIALRRKTLPAIRPLGDIHQLLIRHASVTIMRAQRRSAFSLLFALFQTILAAGQPSPAPAAQSQTPSPTATLSVTARIVTLDVAVTDTTGQPVADLTRDDFRINEDGTLQTIRNFEAPSAHLPSAEAPGTEIVRSSADLDRIGKAPVTVLVLDELNMGFGDEVYARDQVIRWLRVQPPVLSLPTLLLAVTYKDLHSLADFTQDRDSLLNTLVHHYATYPWRSYNAGTISGVASNHLAASLGALEQVAQVTRGVPGQKNVVWVGDGFPSISPTDVTANAADAVFAQQRRLSGLLLQARIRLSILGPTLHPPNRPSHRETGSENLGGDSQFGISPLSGDIQFASLAPPTGGKAYRNRNDLSRALDESLRSGTTYYTLAYTPTNASDNPQQYRHISVQVLRPGFQLQTRDGYFPLPARDPAAPPPTLTQEQLAFDTLGAARSSLAYTDLHITPSRLDPTHWKLRVRASEMAWRHQADGELKADSIILTVCFDIHDRVLGRSVQSVGSETASTEAQLAGHDATLQTAITAPAGTARLRFVVRDVISGRVGTADIRLAL